MSRRLIDLPPGQLLRLKGRQLVEAVRLSEGRTVVAEIATAVFPPVDGCSQAELAAAFGADLLLLNLYDVLHPRVAGFPSKTPPPPVPGLPVGWEESAGFGVTPADVKQMTGRPVGINLEPVPKHGESRVPAGRRATAESVRLAAEQGADFIVLTGNPETGVTLDGMAGALEKLRSPDDGLVWAVGKMHGAGSTPADREWLTEPEIRRIADAGADILLLPVPGTVPGITGERAAEWAREAHRRGLLVMFTIGTSQEGASPETVSRLALAGKEAGGDLMHIGDAGFGGMAPPENIMALSIAIKGRRHTWRRMAQSLRRNA